MKSLLKYSESVTVFAANNELNVEAMTEMADKMTNITSRFHSGQFYGTSAVVNSTEAFSVSYQRVIGIVAWLWHKNDGYGASPVVFQIGICALRERGSARVVKHE